MEKGYFKIGLIMKPHGLKGEVTVNLDAQQLQGIDTLNSVFVLEHSNYVPYFIESISFNGTKAFVKFDDVDSPEAAQKISKKELFLPKTARPKSAKGEFYDDEIIGFEVVDSEHGPLGNVTDVFQTGANRLITVLNDKKREVLIPADSPLIVSINKSKKTISVTLPDGYLDIL